MRGRKPKPSRLRLIEGNPGRRPINQGEPVAPGALIDAPEWFSVQQRTIWDYAITNSPDGLLRRLDRDVLVAWCVACEMHKRACQQQQKLDANTGAPMLTKTKDGNVIQSPYLPIINRQMLLMLKAASELGFSPVSRTRIELDPANGATSKASQYFST